MGGMEPDWFLGISPNAFGIVGAIVNFTTAYIVGIFTGPAPVEIQEMVENFRSPGPAGAAHAH